MVFISVCMATFNGEAFIERQLKSILSQLGQNDEVIISDDGSTDNTIQIVNGFSDKRIKLVDNEGDRGVIGNYQNALTKSSGQFIFLSDQDDIWYPDKMALVMEYLKDYDLVLTDCEVVNQRLEVIHPSFFDHRGSRPGFWRNLYRNSYIGCCMAFRRDILAYVLPFPDHIHMHDWWIGLMVEVKGSVFFFDKPQIKYVRHGNNLSPTGESGYTKIYQFLNRFTLLFYVFVRMCRLTFSI